MEENIIHIHIPSSLATRRNSKLNGSHTRSAQPKNLHKRKTYKDTTLRLHIRMPRYTDIQFGLIIILCFGNKAVLLGFVSMLMLLNRFLVPYLSLPPRTSLAFQSLMRGCMKFVPSVGPVTTFLSCVRLSLSPLRWKLL